MLRARRVTQASPRNNPSGLGSLLDTRRVILCVGCGGVGKTTTTAALGLAAARRGKRVLCLTIDPARPFIKGAAPFASAARL